MGIITVFAVFVGVYTQVIQKDIGVRRRLLVVRKQQLDHKHHKHIFPNVYEELKYVPVVLISYIVFTLPWTTQKLYEGLTATSAPKNVKFTTLIVMGFSFYVPSLVPIHMWKKFRSRKVNPYEDVDGSETENGSICLSSFLDRGATVFGTRRKPEVINGKRTEWAKVKGTCVKIA